MHFKSTQNPAQDPVSGPGMIDKNIFIQDSVAPILLGRKKESPLSMIVWGALIGVLCLVCGIFIGNAFSYKQYRQANVKNMRSGKPRDTMRSQASIVDSEAVADSNYIVHFGIFHDKEKAKLAAIRLTNERYINDVKLAKVLLQGQEEFIVYQGPYTRDHCVNQSNILGYNGILGIVQELPKLMSTETKSPEVKK